MKSSQKSSSFIVEKGIAQGTHRNSLAKGKTQRHPNFQPSIQPNPHSFSAPDPLQWSPGSKGTVMWTFCSPSRRVLEVTCDEGVDRRRFVVLMACLGLWEFSTKTRVFPADARFGNSVALHRDAFNAAGVRRIDLQQPLRIFRSPFSRVLNVILYPLCHGDCTDGHFKVTRF